MTKQEIYNSIKSYEQRSRDRADAAIELVRRKSYDTAVLALIDAKAYHELAKEYAYIADLEEIEND